eukprot:scaffold21310_cov22-Tisochrysis_lutea.AAC.1
MEAKILPTTKAKTLPVRTSKSNFRPPHRHPGCGQPPNQEPVQRWRGRKATTNRHHVGLNFCVKAPAKAGMACLLLVWMPAEQETAGSGH